MRRLAPSLWRPLLYAGIAATGLPLAFALAQRAVAEAFFGGPDGLFAEMMFTPMRSISWFLAPRVALLAAALAGWAGGVLLDRLALPLGRRLVFGFWLGVLLGAASAIVTALTIIIPSAAYQTSSVSRAIRATLNALRLYSPEVLLAGAVCGAVLGVTIAFLCRPVQPPPSPC